MACKLLTAAIDSATTFVLLVSGKVLSFGEGYSAVRPRHHREVVITNRWSCRLKHGYVTVGSRIRIGRRALPCLIRRRSSTLC